VRPWPPALDGVHASRSLSSRLPYLPPAYKKHRGRPRPTLDNWGFPSPIHRR
jgi:hypothetical protein